MQQNRFKHEIAAEEKADIKDALGSYALLVTLVLVLLWVSFQF